MTSPVGYPQGNSLKAFTDGYGANDIPAGIVNDKRVPIYATTSAQGIVETVGGIVLRKKSIIYPTPKWMIAQAKVKAGVGNARVVLIGDSTGMGAWALGTAFTGNRPKKWFHRLKDKIKQMSVSTDSWFGTNGTTINAAGWSPWLAYDSRITATQSVWDVNTSFQAGGFGIKTNGAAGGADVVSFSFAAEGVSDTLDVYLAKSSGLGQLKFDANTLNAQIIDCGVLPYAQSYRATLSFPSGINAYNMTKVGAIVGRLRGQSAYRNNKDVQFIDLSWNAMSVRGYLTGVTGSDVAELADGPRQDFLGIQPDLTLIALGINDSTLSSPLASFIAQYQKLIDIGKLTGDVVLIIESPIDYAGNPNQDLYWQAIVDLAVSNGLNLFDFRNYPMESWTNANALGLYADGRHPVAAGYEFMAQSIYDSGLFGL